MSLLSTKIKFIFSGILMNPFPRLLTLIILLSFLMARIWLITSINLQVKILIILAVIKVNKENSFVLGGISCDFSEVTNSVYSFNMITEEIKYLEPMGTARYSFSAIVNGSYLYVIGGRKIGEDDVSILNSC
jgi:hypothetical protein